MSKKTVKVQYVNPPKEGRKTGSIKTAEGEYFDVFPGMLPEFKQGGSYEIEYASRDYNGKTYHSVKSILNGTNGATGTGETPDARQNSIVRQHSQEMAMRYLAAKIAAGPSQMPDNEQLRALIDWFQRDASRVAVDPAKKAVPATEPTLEPEREPEPDQRDNAIAYGADAGLEL
jgi:hypothetical protein